MFLNVKKRANQAGSTMGLAASSSAIQSLTMVSDDETKLARFGDRVSSSPKTSPKSVKQKEIEDVLNSSNDQMSPLLNLLKGMAGGTGQDTTVKTEATTDENNNDNQPIFISKNRDLPPTFIRKMILLKKKRKTNTISCRKPRCKHTSNCSNDLWNHIVENHSGDYLCPKCVNLVTANAIEDHFITCHNHVCEVCKRTFCRKSVLKQHSDRADCSIDLEQFSIPNKRVKIENQEHSIAAAE